jgi:two-component system, LytTR family, response regulator
MKLRALVVDDEPVARAGLSMMVRADPHFVDVRECGDRDAAVSAIETDRPDLVLLDIQLTPGTGFDVIERVGASRMPAVIFVTAFDRYALEAFDAAAIDYVVKPPDPARLALALTRAKARIREARTADDATRLAILAAALRQPPAPRPIALADGERTLLFEPNEIVWIEAADDYARVHARGRPALVRETLEALETRLPSPPFFRVHRSAIVNLRFVTEVTRTSRHRYIAALRDGTRVPVSEGRRQALEAWLRAGQL